jgi:hypothetical protein
MCVTCADCSQGASRVVLLDALWNPTHELQAVFRAYRFGQVRDCVYDHAVMRPLATHSTMVCACDLSQRCTAAHSSQQHACRVGQQVRTVHVYRLMAAGTMEEKIYNRQVNKQGLAARVVDEHQVRPATGASRAYPRFRGGACGEACGRALAFIFIRRYLLRPSCRLVFASEAPAPPAGLCLRAKHPRLSDGERALVRGLDGRQVARAFRNDDVENLWALEEDDFWERQRKGQGGGDEEEGRAPKAKGADGSSVNPILLDDSDNENDPGWDDSGAEERSRAQSGEVKIVNKQKDAVLDYLQHEFPCWIVRSFEHDSLLQVCDPRLPLLRCHALGGFGWVSSCGNLHVFSPPESDRTGCGCGLVCGCM